MAKKGDDVDEASAVGVWMEASCKTSSANSLNSGGRLVLTYLLQGLPRTLGTPCRILCLTEVSPVSESVYFLDMQHTSRFNALVPGNNYLFCRFFTFYG